MNRKILFIILFIFSSFLAFTQQRTIYKPTNQPDADGRIIKGRDGTHNWQPYMINADLSNYHHAPQEAIEQFQNMKYGIRIHWGIYSIAHGRESWIINSDHPDETAFQRFYPDLYKSWYSWDYVSDKWTDIMVKNGFKFFGEEVGSIVPTYMYYSIMETPFKRDITGELVTSARARGLKIGLYFLHSDWFETDFRFDEWTPQVDTTYTPENYPEAWQRFTQRHKGQIRELLSNYGKVDMMPFDKFFPEFAWDHMQETARIGITIKLPSELQNEEIRPSKQAFAFKINGNQLS